MPGIDMGTQKSGLIAPPLPDEQPMPGWSLSTRVTLWPSRCKVSAQAAPTIPAPTTTTLLCVLFRLSIAFASVRQTRWRQPGNPWEVGR